ncbi:MAG: hypothetical protein EYC69_00445 [Bacteroidetes bacterium]|nr:MAG: hypothetical protein EYC69_00445 [Bacteroidota bacterium]
MKYFAFIPAVLFLAMSFNGCKKPDEFPLVPFIEFKSIYSEKDAQGFDQKVFVTVSFTDGDGDIGYHSRESGRNDAIFDDPSSPYFNNFIVKTFILKNGSWNSIDTPVSARIPYLTPEGPNKALRGEISREFALPVALVQDTLRYDIFIYDRSLNQSNTITTSTIILNTR